MEEERKNNSGRKWFDGKDEKDVISKCKEIWALDGSDLEASSYADISKDSISRYLKAHPELKEYRDRLRQRPVLKARQEVIKGLNCYTNAMDYLKRKKKMEFGDNIDVTSDNDKITGFNFIKNEKKD
jgi:hypothetical protein